MRTLENELAEIKEKLAAIESLPQRLPVWKGCVIMRIKPDTKVTDIIDSHEKRLRWMELCFLVMLVIRVAKRRQKPKSMADVLSEIVSNLEKTVDEITNNEEAAKP